MHDIKIFKLGFLRYWKRSFIDVICILLSCKTDATKQTDIFDVVRTYIVQNYVFLLILIHSTYLYISQTYEIWNEIRLNLILKLYSVLPPVHT